MKQLDEAIKEFRAVTALDPKNAWAHYDLALALQDKKQLAEAIREFRAFIALDPKNAGVRNNLGVALRDNNQLEEAIREFRAAIALDPKDAEKRKNLGVALCDKGQLDEGIGEFRAAVALDPKNARFHGCLGIAYGNLGQWDKAAAAVTRVLELDPSNHGWWYMIAALRLHTGDVPGYRRACCEMLARFGKTGASNVAEQTAKTCLLAPDAVGDFELVRKLADLAVEKNGSERWILLTKALAEYRAGRCTMTIEWLQRIRPKANGDSLDATAFALLAMARKRQGQAEEARRALDQAQAILVQKPPKPKRGERFSSDWHDLLRAQILAREAEGLLLHGSVRRTESKPMANRVWQ